MGAPQAGALQAAINIVQEGNIPLGKYLTGALLGLLVSLLVSPGLGVMVGLSLYLPFKYMIVFGMVTVASLASGGLMNCAGGSAVEGWNAVNIAMVPFLVLAGGSLIWLARQPRLAPPPAQ